MINDLINFLADNFKIPRETVATILITLTTFLLGFLLNILITGFNHYLQRRIHRRLSRINFIFLLRGIHKQAQNFSDIKVQLTIEHPGNFHYKYQIIPSLEVFNKIGYENLYNAYFRGFENFSLFRSSQRISSFNILWSTIEYMNHAHIQATSKVDEFIKEHGKLNDLRNSSLGQVQEIIENFRIYFHRKLELQEPLGVFYKERETIIKNYHDQEDHTLAHKTEEYIQNLINLNRDNVDLIQRYERDINSVRLNSSILESSLRYQNMKNHIDSYNYYFDYLSTNYFEGFEKLKKSYRVLNNYSLLPKYWRALKIILKYVIT